MPRSPFALVFAAAVLLSGAVGAQEPHGQHGVGHDAWHGQFYNKLMRKDTKTSCCNLADCRPTEHRVVDDHYEVLVDGDWVRADHDVIQSIAAPDGGTHVCAPRQVGTSKGKLYCVVLPPET
jgi:hypothetical protein